MICSSFYYILPHATGRGWIFLVPGPFEGDGSECMYRGWVCQKVGIADGKKSRMLHAGQQKQVIDCIQIT